MFCEHIDLSCEFMSAVVYSSGFIFHSDDCRRQIIMIKRNQRHLIIKALNLNNDYYS